MRKSRKGLVVMLMVLLGLLFLFSGFTEAAPTRKKYGKNIVYYDFSKIPDNLVLNRKIEPPKDLKKFLEDEWNNPRIEDPLCFEQEIWQEADKFGYTPDSLKSASVKEAIMAAVEIVISRFTPYGVDEDEDFIKEHGRHLSIDNYFHLKLGDCDKYRDAAIGVFDIIKRLNPQLQNVYLSTEKLGSSGAFHAWVSILIPQDNYLVLSHIDPIFFDNGKPLEAGDFHICLKHNIFIANFYKRLGNAKNCIYAYKVLEEEFLKLSIDDKEWQEEILHEMSFVALFISIYKPRAALKKFDRVSGLYQANECTKNFDSILYCAYEIYLRAGYKSDAEKCKQLLLKEFPDSFWSEVLKDSANS